MDIFKVIGKQVFNKEYEHAYFGNFPVNKLHDRFQIPFSTNSEVYYHALKDYIIGDSDFYTFRSFIPRFIDSCLILGEAYHKIKKMHMDYEHLTCDATLYLGTHLNGYIKCLLGEDIADFRHFAIEIQANLNEIVTFVVNAKSGRRGEYYVSKHLESFTRHDYESIPGLTIHQRGPNSYRIMDTKFNPPRIQDLPLYINVPFIRTYANEIYKTGIQEHNQ
jgi:hypothetical protein